MDKLQEALVNLDPNNSEHWTSDGLPLVSYLAQATDNLDLRRTDIMEVDPTLTRDRRLGEQNAAREAREKPELPSRDSLETRMAEISGKIKTCADKEKEFSERRTELEYRLARVQRQYDRLLEAEPKHNPVNAYISAKEKEQDIRVEKHRALLESGVTMDAVLAQLDPRSPLDRAMAQRKLKPGQQRPVFNPTA